MNRNNCCTASLAQIYEDQGHLERAVWVYRQLLEDEPQRKDWQTAVERLERSIQERPCKRVEDLLPLMCQWVDLAICFRRASSARGINAVFHIEPSVVEKPEEA